MFCYQCEQTAKGQGCDKMGVCGKTPEVAALQDLLVHSLKELSVYAVEAEKQGVLGDEVGPFTVAALFSTLTNVTFDRSGLNQREKQPWRVTLPNISAQHGCRNTGGSILMKKTLRQSLKIL